MVWRFTYELCSASIGCKLQLPIALAGRNLRPDSIQLVLGDDAFRPRLRRSEYAHHENFRNQLHDADRTRTEPRKRSARPFEVPAKGRVIAPLRPAGRERLAIEHAGGDNRIPPG